MSAPEGRGNSGVIGRTTNPKEAIAETGNPRAKDTLFELLWPIFKEDVPLTILYPVTWTQVVRSRIRGLSSPFRGDPVWYMEDLWLDDRNQ